MDTEKILYFCTSLVSSVVNAFKQRPASVNSILIVKLDEIGDMVYTLHCIEKLKKQYPKAEISVYCKPMNNSLVLQTGCVSNVVNDFTSLHTRYDIQIDFRGNWQTLKRVIFGKCNIYLDRGSIRLKNKFAGGQSHEVITNQETIAWLFPSDEKWDKPRFHITPSDIDFAKTLAQTSGAAKYVVMHCGARDKARRWPVDRFAFVIDYIFDNYGFKTLLVGSESESELNHSVASKSKHAINVAGKTSLIQMAALMRTCEFFVGNESGPLHFAIVEQKPLVALFGPGVKDVFYPLYPNQKVIHHVNDTQTEEEKKSSIMKISVQEVLDEIVDLNN